MDICNHLIKAILLAALCALPVMVSRAADEDSCLSGEFETDLAQITRSFLKPDTRRVTQETSQLIFPQSTPAEIARIRSGVILTLVNTDFGPHFIDWKAYDADRHLFVLVKWGSDYSFTDADGDRCNGYQYHLRTSDDMTYCLAIVAGTPDQARQFACRANRISARLAEDVARAAIEAQEATRRRDEESANIRAAAEAEAAAESTAGRHRACIRIG